MVVVPRIEQQTVAERPLLQTQMTTRASAEDFGAGIGRGLQGLAQGVQQASNSFAALKELEDTTSAKEADTQLAAWMRERQYGEGGFMTLSGKAAVDGRAAYEADLEQKRSAFGEGLGPGAAQVYGNASTARVNSALESSIVHTAQQRKVWFGDATAARLNSFADDALAVWNNPNKVDFNIAAGQAELRSQAELMGWDADVLRNKEQQYISDVRKNVALRTAIDDPIAAKSYLDQYKDQLTGEAQASLEEKLQVPLANAEGMKAASEFMGTATRVPAGPNAGQGPTRNRAFLTDRLVTKGRTEDIDGLDGSFVNNLSAMMEDAPFEGLGVLSGSRTPERQAGIIADQINGYLPGMRAAWESDVSSLGAVAAGASWEARLRAAGMTKNVALPGRSNHQHGQAVDLSYNGKSLKHAPKEVLDWVHGNAGNYGMTFPMSWENWHIEPVNARGASTAVANTGNTVPRASAPSRVQIEQYLAAIPNPKARDVARSAIMANINAQAEDAKTQRTAVQEAAFSEMITSNVSPYSFSPEVQSMVGREGMSNLMSYWDKVSAGEKIQTEPELLYAMQTAYATDPEAFAKVDLLQYRAQMSDEDWKTISGWRQTALTDQRKANDAGTVLTGAFSMSTTALEAAGITTTGKDGGQRVAAAKQIAMFQNVLAQELEDMRAANNGKAPTPLEQQQLINRLLLPVVIRQGGPSSIDPGMVPNPLSTLGRMFSGNETKGFLFEAGNRPDGSTVDVALEYNDVPMDLRQIIRSDLETDLGRVPTEQEVVDAYEKFLLAH